MDKLKIGADPEFVVVGSEGALVPASLLFQGTSVGHDGNPRIGELRPEPGTPSQVVINIKGMLGLVQQRLNGKGVAVAGACPCPGTPIGGHIHFSIKPSSELLRLLDWYVGLPLALLEGPEGEVRRTTGNAYGAVSSMREKPWGFEYRTPGSWLVSEGITATTLAIAYRLAKGGIKPPAKLPVDTLTDRYKMLNQMDAVEKGWKELAQDSPRLMRRLLRLGNWIHQGRLWKKNLHDDMMLRWNVCVPTDNDESVWYSRVMGERTERCAERVREVVDKIDYHGPRLTVGIMPGDYYWGIDPDHGVQLRGLKGLLAAFPPSYQNGVHNPRADVCLTKDGTVGLYPPTAAPDPNYVTFLLRAIEGSYNNV